MTDPTSALPRCCNEHVGRMGVLSPTTCTTCGRTLSVKDAEWRVTPALPEDIREDVETVERGFGSNPVPHLHDDMNARAALRRITDALIEALRRANINEDFMLGNARRAEKAEAERDEARAALREYEARLDEEGLL